MAKRAIAAGVIFLLAWLGSPCCSAEPASPKTHIKSISVAVSSDSVPYYFLDKQGKPAGLLVDLWKLWSKKTGIKVKFKSASFGDTIKMVRSGQADVHAGLFYSKERDRFLDYVDPVTTLQTHFFFNKNIYGLKDINDLMGFDIGVIKGDFAVEFLREHLPGASLAIYADNKALFDAVAKGDVKVFVKDTAISLAFLSRMGLRKNFRYNAKHPLYQKDFIVAVKQGNHTLPPIIRQGMARITTDEKNEIERRWAGSSRSEADNVLLIACDRNQPPFTWLTNSGAPAGILVDIWRLWATRTGQQIDFVFGDGMEPLEFIRSGRSDIEAALFKELDLEQWLDFSLPLYPVEINLFYLAKQGPVSLEEMAGKRVGIVLSKGYLKHFQQQYPKIKVVTFAEDDKAFNALISHDIAALVDIGVCGEFMIDRLGLSGEIARSPTGILAKTYYAAVLKGREGLLELVNKGLRDIPQQEILAIEERWIHDPKQRQYAKLSKMLRLSEEEKDWLAKHRNIKLGIDPNWMPFEAFDPSGKFEGIAAEYVQNINKMLGVDMQPVKGLSRSQVIRGVRAKKIDVLPAVVGTSERAGFLNFTRPYLAFPNVLVTRNDAPGISGLASLQGASVAVVRGHALTETLASDFGSIDFLPVENVEQGLEAVVSGEAAAYIDNIPAITYASKKLAIKDIKVAATTKYETRLSFGVRKDWPELVSILEKTLQTFSDEERKTIESRWINVRFTDRTDWAFVLAVSASVGLVVAIIIALVVVWNRRMAKEVGQRKAAEDRFASMAANVPGAIFQVLAKEDGSIKYFYLSQRAEEFFGIPPREVIANNSPLNTHPGDAQRVGREFKQAIVDRREVNITCRVCLSDGVIKWVNINASPSQNPDGELVYDGFILDITERKLAEQEYLASERKIKAMSQAVEDSLIMIDSRGMVMFWNPAAERLFGYSADEAMGRRFHELAAPEKYHEEVGAGLERFAETGQGPVLGVTTEITACNRLGEEFPVEVTLSSFQLEDEWFAVGTVRDISQRKQAEQAIRDSERHMADIIDFLPDPALVIDTQGKVLFWNRSMERLTGIAKADMLGKDDYAYALPFYGERRPILADLVQNWDENLAKQYSSVTKEGETLVAESWHPRLGEDGLYLSATATVLRDAQGEKAGAIETLRDITERYAAEHKLRESEQRLDLALAGGNLGIWDADFEAGKTVVDRRWAELMDVDHGSPEDPFHAWMRRIHPDDVELVRDIGRRYREGDIDEYEVTYRIRTDDGSERWQTSRGKAVRRDEAGKVARMVGTVMDVTAQKAAEAALAESEERSRLLLHSVGEGIFGVNAEGRVIFINSAALSMLGYTEAEIMGQMVHTLIHHSRSDGGDYPMDECPMHASFTAGSAHHVEDEVLWDKDGLVIPVEFSTTPINKGSQVVGAVVTFRDVSERKAAEDELRRNLDELERFNSLVVGREIKMISLKEEINQLLKTSGLPEKYKIVQ